jgi:energy-coupling factor transport system permease protein
MNPLNQAGLGCFICAACFASSSHLFVLGLLISNILIAYAGKILAKAKGTFKALFILGLFLMLFQLLFTNTGRVYFYILPGVPITDDGVSFSLLLMLKMMAALSPLSLMLMLTPMNELLTAMVDKLKVPYQYAFVVITALRFIPTFSHEMDQIMQAQMSRGHATERKIPLRKSAWFSLCASRSLFHQSARSRPWPYPSKPVVLEQAPDLTEKSSSLHFGI